MTKTVDTKAALARIRVVLEEKFIPATKIELRKKRKVIAFVRHQYRWWFVFPNGRWTVDGVKFYDLSQEGRYHQRERGRARIALPALVTLGLVSKADADASVAWLEAREKERDHAQGLRVLEADAARLGMKVVPMKAAKLYGKK